MELLLSYRILWPSSTAYCRKCSVPNALSVMKNNMGSSTILEAKGTEFLGSLGLYGQVFHTTCTRLVEIGMVDHMTPIHDLVKSIFVFSVKKRS